MAEKARGLFIWVKTVLLWPPFLFASLFVFVYSCRIKNLYCHFIFFWTLYYLLLSRVYLHCHRCFSFFYFYFTCGGTCMTLYDSFLLYFTQRLLILFHLSFLLPSIPFCACASLPFSFFYLSIFDSFLPAPYSPYTAPYSCFTSIFYSVCVPCMTRL